MKNFLVIIIITIHLLIVAKRLPDWNDNKSIWVSAVNVEPLDPWNLNNAAHFTHDKRASVWLANIYYLNISDWLPFNERQPYIVGLKSLADSLRVSGYNIEADLVNNRLNEITSGHKVIVGYVSQ